MTHPTQLSTEHQSFILNCLPPQRRTQVANEWIRRINDDAKERLVLLERSVASITVLCENDTSEPPY